MGRVKDIADETRTEMDEFLTHLDWTANPFVGQPSLDEYVLPSKGDIADIASAIQNYTGPLVIHSRFSGAGKTTLQNVLLDEFSDDHIPVRIGEHNVTAYELASIVADDLGIGKSSSTKLTEQKIREADLDESVLVGIDEFGLNDPATLHVAQFLNDLDDFKLVLTGMTSQYEALGTQSDEGEYIADEKAFTRRISYTLELEPLSFDQTLELYRRRVATVDDDHDLDDWERVPLYPFGRDTLKVIHEQSEGIPGVTVAALNRLLGLVAYQHAQDKGDTVSTDLAEGIDYPDPRADD